MNKALCLPGAYILVGQADCKQEMFEETVWYNRTYKVYGKKKLQGTGKGRRSAGVGGKETGYTCK